MRSTHAPARRLVVACALLHHAVASTTPSLPPETIIASRGASPSTFDGMIRVARPLGFDVVDNAIIEGMAELLADLEAEVVKRDVVFESSFRGPVQDGAIIHRRTHRPWGWSWRSRWCACDFLNFQRRCKGSSGSDLNLMYSRMERWKARS